MLFVWRRMDDLVMRYGGIMVLVKIRRLVIMGMVYFFRVILVNVFV